VSEGIVAIAGSTLRIFVTDWKPGTVFSQTVVPSRYTPRRVAELPASPQHPNKLLVLVLEADQNRYTDAEKRGLQEIAASASVAKEVLLPQDDDAMDIAMDEDDAMDLVGGKREQDDDDEDDEEVRIMGPMPPRPGHWASCLRVIDALDPTANPLELFELGEAEAAISCATCTFAGRGGEVFVAVGTATALEFGAGGRSHRGCSVHVYRLLDARLVFLHKTPIEDVPLVLLDFRGRLLVTVGRAVRLYDLGKRKLLRKTEHSKLVPNLIVKLEARGDRIYAADATESVFFAKYVRDANKFCVFADDPIARASAALCVLDYDTVAVADKFGNVAVLRLAADADDDVEDPSGTSNLFYADGYAANSSSFGGTHKLLTTANFHVGSAVVAMAKTSLAAGADDALFYATVDGSIGALVPSRSRDDKDFFTMLEMHLRQDYPAFLTGRDHISFRSAFVPVNNVVDGDLCDRFTSLKPDAQHTIASDLDRTPTEVAKKIEDTKHRLL